MFTNLAGTLHPDRFILPGASLGRQWHRPSPVTLTALFDIEWKHPVVHRHTISRTPIIRFAGKGRTSQIAIHATVVFRPVELDLRANQIEFRTLSVYQR